MNRRQFERGGCHRVVIIVLAVGMLGLGSVGCTGLPRTNAANRQGWSWPEVGTTAAGDIPPPPRSLAEPTPTGGTPSANAAVAEPIVPDPHAVIDDVAQSGKTAIDHVADSARRGLNQARGRLAQFTRRLVGQSEEMRTQADHLASQVGEQHRQRMTQANQLVSQTLQKTEEALRQTNLNLESSDDLPVIEPPSGSGDAPSVHNATPSAMVAPALLPDSPSTSPVRSGRVATTLLPPLGDSEGPQPAPHDTAQIEGLLPLNPPKLPPLGD